jgi:hypothetical protein
MWLWSWDTVSLFILKRTNNGRGLSGSLQLLAVFERKNEKVFEDRTPMWKWIIVYIYSVGMSLWSWDNLWFFDSKRANNWREPPGCLLLLDVVETNNERVAEDQRLMRKWIIVYKYSVVMWLSSSDALWFFASKRANNGRASNGSIPLLAHFEIKNERASVDQSDMTTE